MLEHKGRPTTKLNPVRALALVVGAVMILVVGGFVYRRLSPPATVSTGTSGHKQESTTPKVTPVATLGNAEGYVGIQACAECHADRVKEFKQTRHYLSCTPPNPAQMPAVFNAEGSILQTSDPTLQFKMIKEGDDYVVKTIRTRPGGGSEENSLKVAFVYGQGGIADLVFFGWHGDGIYESPVVRLLPQDEWGTSKYDPARDLELSRELTPRCLECHTTWFKHKSGTLNEYDRKDILFGVTCEKCHGPGRDHVIWHQAHPGASSGKEIVHPGHLPHERLSAVCGQCHSNVAKYRSAPFSFRPGEKLEDYYKILESRFPEDNHVANQDKYMRESKCFQHSEKMTCITCHDPHHVQERDAPSRQKTCLQCHAAEACLDRPNLPVAVRDDCIGCHMPLVNKIQVHFRTANDFYVPPAKRYEHRIGLYPLHRKEMILQWRRKQDDVESRMQAEQLEQELGQDWIAKGDELQAVHRYIAAADAYRQAERIHPTPEGKAKLKSAVAREEEYESSSYEVQKLIQEKRFEEAVTMLKRILEIKPDAALVHGKLGSVYAALGQKELAREQLEMVAQLDPDEPYGESMLGWLAYLDGRHNEAVEYQLRAEQLEPRNFKIKYQLGLAYMGLRQWSEAAIVFRKVLEIDPTHAGAHQGLGHSLREQGMKEEGLKSALRAAELTRFGNADILLSLADAYADNGDLAQAEKTASRALALAGGDRLLVPRILAKVEEYRKRSAGSR